MPEQETPKNTSDLFSTWDNDNVATPQVSKPHESKLKSPELLSAIRRTFSRQTWFVSLLSPVVAVLIGFLVSLFTVLAQGNLFLNATLAGTQPTLPAIPSALLVTALGLGGTWNITITLPSAPQLAPRAPIHIDLFVPALTITVIVGLTLYLCHMFVGRGKRNSTLLVWIPAWISALTLSALAALLAFSTKVFLESPVPPLGTTTFVAQPSIWLTALLALPVGLFCSAFGRLSTLKNSPSTRFALTSASFIPTFAHAVRIAFAVYLAGALVCGLASLPPAIDYLIQIPGASFISFIPFIFTIGAAALQGLLMGVGFINVASTMRPSAHQTALILPIMPSWEVVCGFILLFALLLGAAYRWGRTRDPLLEYGPFAWIPMPFAFTSVLAILNVIGRASITTSDRNIKQMFSFGISWYVIFAGVVLGLIVEGLSRIFRTKPPVSETSGFLLPHESSIPGRLNIPGAPDGVAVHPGDPSTDIAENPTDYIDDDTETSSHLEGKGDAADYATHLDGDTNNANTCDIVETVADGDTPETSSHLEGKDEENIAVATTAVAGNTQETPDVQEAADTQETTDTQDIPDTQETTPENSATASALAEAENPEKTTH
ncbi:hypothetical protein R6G69_05280 [Actinotignum urinale]|uniref:hypothetical protein n=1 Tax=Actinotignum urinale TaxID=190146 RepID=UPI002A81F2F5|nr:hypothetical protein [Actinotignum urinale]MDY5129405.1 hypothetical protein [Actinotignum urinale]